MTGETGGVRSWEPCCRELYKDTGLCVDHARDAGLIARSEITPEMREKMTAGWRARKKAIQSGEAPARKRRARSDPAVTAEKKAQASATFAEVRRLRKEATARRRMREAAVDSRMNKPRGVRPSD